MPIAITVEQLIAFGGILLAGAGGYFQLKGRVDVQERESKINLDTIRDNAAETDEEVQKVWKKMLTIHGHSKECEIMNLKIGKAIRESADAIQEKVEGTMVDFQKKNEALIKQVLEAVKANGGKGGG